MLDIMQELWEKRNQKIISGELAAYLRRCMRNKIIVRKVIYEDYSAKTFERPE